MSSLTDPLGPDLKATLRSLKLGKLTATLPERLTLARQNNMPHADFLQLVLSDEVTRREAGSIALRARNAGLDPAMRTETWDPTAAIRYDQQLWNELVSLRFLDAPYGALILGPVGVGKTHLATALGHIAVRRRRTVAMARADKLFKRLTAARLDNTLEAEYRRLAAVELLIIDDFALQPLTPAQTTDFYEIITERHRRASTVVTSNRDASEWLPLMTDPLLAQSAIDRLTSTCHELIVEGDSYRRRQRPPAPQVSARAHGHVAADQKGQAAEHALLGDPGLCCHEFADAVGEILVVGHTGIIALWGAARLVAPAAPAGEPAEQLDQRLDLGRAVALLEQRLDGGHVRARRLLQLLLACVGEHGVGDAGVGRAGGLVDEAPLAQAVEQARYA